MALRTGTRFKPDTFRGAQETFYENPTRASPGAPLQADVVRVVQLVVYDDAVIVAGSPGAGQVRYRAGSEETESRLIIADQEVIRVALSALRGKTLAAQTAIWQAALQAQDAAWAPDRIDKGMAIYAAFLATPVVQ
jgi:hypothetical protein